jgi:hypothetical protein
MRLRFLLLPLLAALAVTLGARHAAGQQPAFERLPASTLDVTPPAGRVRGVPGTMSVQARACRILPTGDTRRRIVEIAAQEWGFFGFRVAAPREAEDDEPAAGPDDDSRERRRRRSRLPAAEAARVASTIAAYWAVTPEGPWIVGRQNDEWNGPDGIAARWNAPWSAAFLSWVMCEAGLGTTAQFQRAIAHHAYIDQAIRARDGRAPQAAFVAHDPGEAAIAPGDLLCSSRRPAYRTIAERRRQMGVGARSHCDVVVTVDAARGHVLAIGGNVRGVVSLKLLPAYRTSGGLLRPDTGDDERPIFAHLTLRAAPIAPNALDASLTLKASGCALALAVPAGSVGTAVTMPAASC